MELQVFSVELRLAYSDINRSSRMVAGVPVVLGRFGYPRVHGVFDGAGTRRVEWVEATTGQIAAKELLDSSGGRQDPMKSSRHREAELLDVDTSSGSFAFEAVARFPRAHLAGELERLPFGEAGVSRVGAERAKEVARARGATGDHREVGCRVLVEVRATQQLRRRVRLRFERRDLCVHGGEAPADLPEQADTRLEVLGVHSEVGDPRSGFEVRHRHGDVDRFKGDRSGVVGPAAGNESGKQIGVNADLGLCAQRVLDE